MNDTTTLKYLRDQSKPLLAIHPETKEELNNISDKYPLVILIHGYQGGKGDMTEPGRTLRSFPFDITWRPADLDEGYHYGPPPPQPFNISLVNPLPKISRRLDAGKPSSWFEFFKSKGWPVLAYSQGDGTNTPLDEVVNGKAIGASVRLLEIMKEIHEKILTGINSCTKIAFLGQSRGGIIARRYIVEALNGDLDPIHQEIVEKRVRFLGTLNTPHLGSNLGYLPDLVECLIETLTRPLVPIPFLDEWVSSGIADAILQPLMEWFDLRQDTIDELLPASILLNSIEEKDRALLGNDLLTGDIRIRRIRRASTSGDNPVLLRLFSPHFYKRSSDFPDLKRLTDYEELLESLWDAFTGLFKGEVEPPLPPPFFHWESTSTELSISPIIQDKHRDTSMLDVLNTLFPGFEFDIFPELRSSRDHPGGDYIVSDSSASAMPPSERSQHLLVPHQHYYTLWDWSYKEFIENFMNDNLVPLFCYPEISFKKGDNLVELSWESRSSHVNYRVFRYVDGNVSGEDRSGELERIETLFYDPISEIAPFRYLISYKDSEGIEAPSDYLESTKIGSLLVTIKPCRLDTNVEAGYIPFFSRISAASARDKFLVFSITDTDLLVDIIEHSLEPLGERIKAVTSSLWRISEPYSSTTKENVCHTVWIEYSPGFESTGAARVDVGDGSSLRVRDESANNEHSGDSSQGMVRINYDWFQYRLLAGEFQNDGTPSFIQEVVQYGEDSSPRQKQSLLGGAPIESPRFLSHGKGFLLAWTASSGKSLWVIETDLSFSPLDENPMEIPLASDSFPIITVNPFGDSLELPVVLSGSTKSFVLHDLFSAKKEDRFIALIELLGSNILYVVNFRSPSSGGGSQVTIIEMPWYQNYCSYKGSTISGNPDQLYLFLSFHSNYYPEYLRGPQYAKFNFNDDHSIDVSSVDWTFLNFPEIPETVANFNPQDVIKRCDDEIEVLFSSTGFFQKDQVSSSLFRVKIKPGNGNPDFIENELLHHSGYGPYLVTYTRKAFTSDQNAVFWLATDQGVFARGLHGQKLLHSIVECSDQGYPNFKSFVGLILNPDDYGIFHLLCKKPQLEWITSICTLFEDPRFLFNMIQDDGFRSPFLEVLWEFKKLGRRVFEQRNFPDEFKNVKRENHKLYHKTIALLDIIFTQASPEVKEIFRKLARQIKWEPKNRRIKEFSSYLIKK